MSFTAIHLRVQIETGQKHPCGCLVGTSVRIGFGILQNLRAFSLAYDVLQFVDNELKQLGTSGLLSLLGRNRSHKRRISIEVHQIVVVERTHETGLSTFGKCFGVRAANLLQIVV